MLGFGLNMLHDDVLSTRRRNDFSIELELGAKARVGERRDLGWVVGHRVTRRHHREPFLSGFRLFNEHLDG